MLIVMLLEWSVILVEADLEFLITASVFLVLLIWVLV